MQHDIAVVKERLIAQLHAALIPYYTESDPATYVAMYADEATAFDPWSAGRKADAALIDYLMALAGSIPHLAYELIDPRVDLVGDAAVFTFGVDVRDPGSGQQLAVWNATQVHDLAGDTMALVHTHWSYAVPPPEETD